MSDLAARRNDYTGQTLSESAVPSDPLSLFQAWLDAALDPASGIYEPTAMTLATVGSDGAAAARVVLLKDFDERGFVFYTNYESAKARDLDADRHASLLFYWDRLHRQVRIGGRAARTSVEESREYFQSRPRDSQIAAWASRQSGVIDNRAALEEAFARCEESFKDREKIDLPPFWGGYRVEPMSFEFWQGQPNRLHDRLRYDRSGQTWTQSRLAP